MDALTQSLRERAAGFYRWLLGRDAAQQQRRQEEQTTANGVIRQMQDPDYVLAQQQLAAPLRAGEEMSMAQRTFAQLGQRTAPSPPAQQFIVQIDAMQQRLQAQRQAEQEAQRRGHEHGR